MLEIRWHGRAGQGIVTVSRLLAEAAFMEGKHVQAFPFFGPERLGSPLSGFTRISDDPIEIHSLIYNPDIVIVLDESLPSIVNVTEGLKKEGALLINTKKSPEEIKKALQIANNCYTVDATKISFDIIGSGIAFNTAMLGALVKVKPIASVESLGKSLVKTFGKEIGQKNIEVVVRANKEVTGL
ncbi:MAG: 2-oxoacid:acceptor oxidoreductase family protein [Candidatus Bathyarchaeota archaeon]